ncbi:MAG: hypothetical protein LH679_01980 [Cyanobacteria bacterium CAN_BIN43]|nr:hypothetical protein [Cyanobacteria bacterium CAN_BIN43]
MSEFWMSDRRLTRFTFVGATIAASAKQRDLFISVQAETDNLDIHRTHNRPKKLFAILPA